MNSLWKGIVGTVAVVAVIAGSWWYVKANYVPKPEPYDARSVLYGMGLRESYFNQSIQAFQARDSVRQNKVTAELRAVIDSLTKAIEK